MTAAAISPDARRRVLAAFANCCAYCRSAQEYIPDILEIEHIIPRCRDGSDDEINLCLACGTCNRCKAARITANDPVSHRRVALFQPRTQEWTDHFRWSKSGLEVVGITPSGRATVVALHFEFRSLVKHPVQLDRRRVASAKRLAVPDARQKHLKLQYRSAFTTSPRHPPAR